MMETLTCQGIQGSLNPYILASGTNVEDMGSQFVGSKSGHLETSLHASLPRVCLHHFETGIVNATTKLPSP